MIEDASPQPARRLLYLVSEDWYFCSHRLPMALAAQSAGYDVHVATRVQADGAAIEALGFKLHPLPWRRGSTNPFGRLRLIADVRRLYRGLQPDLVHHVALEPTVIGSIAALGLPLRTLNAMAGLGFVFTSRSPKALLFGFVVRALLRFLLTRRNAAVLVQNEDDRAAIAALGISPDRVFLIAGSGVDADQLKPMPEPAGPITVGFVGRLLDDKGIRTLIAAHEVLGRRGRPVRLLLAGEPDPANPASIPPHEIASWKVREGLEVLGHVADIREVWAAAHIAVLPSRREGLPKSLLEAAACGRAIVATDVPGCRVIARDGVNALLVPPDDPAALADAIELLSRNPVLRRTFADAGRRMVEEEFSSARIGQETVALYDKLLWK
ncbi:MAG TPA: glycosyltransferase family 4 protein [Xanthobacteraceae bacterium]|nr:glycosyltransferase family 4 protein [Xanthobacteraceae bacterium]